MCEAVLNILNDILRVETIEEAFSCVLVHRVNLERDKISAWEQELAAVLRNASAEQIEIAIRQYLVIAANTSHSRLQLLMELLEQLVKSGTVPARLVCDIIITNDKLIYQNQDFWLKSFKLLKNIIDNVEYKGVRDIMKVI